MKQWDRADHPRLGVARSPFGVGADLVAVSGDFDELASGLEMTELLDECVDERRHVVLDLSRTEYIGSAGLAVLVRAQQQLAEVDRDIVLVQPHAQVARILELTGMDDVLVSVDTEDAAREALLRGSAADPPA